MILETANAMLQYPQTVLKTAVAGCDGVFWNEKKVSQRAKVCFGNETRFRRVRKGVSDLKQGCAGVQKGVSELKQGFAWLQRGLSE